MSVFWMIVIFLIVGFIISEPINKKKHSDFMEVQEALKDCMQYNPKEQTLTVKSLSPYFKKSLFTKAYMEDNYGYKKEKYVYTGASVGGVTMGGVHKTGGNYIEAVKTSKVQLMFYSCDPAKKSTLYDKNIVRKIRLSSDDLIKKAQESPISKYLKNDCIIVEKEIDNKRLNSALLTAAQVGNMNMAGNFNECAKTETMPTKEKCDAIIEWLSTCD